MSSVTAWLEDRTPAAPVDLAKEVETAVEELAAGAPSPRPDERPADAPEEHAQLLKSASMDRLDRAVARPGRVRSSAFDLLTADALITYACEAALATDRPRQLLEELVEVGRTR